MTKRAEKRLKLRKKYGLFNKAKNVSDSNTSAESNTQITPNSESSNSTNSNQKLLIKNPFIKFYHDYYKQLLIIPILLLLLAIFQIGYQMTTTGDFLYRDISLKGGISLTIPIDESISFEELQIHIINNNIDASVRTVRATGRDIAYLVEADLDIDDGESVEKLLRVIEEKIPLIEGEYSVETIGSSIGNAFFKQALFALILSFIIMGLIVAINFKAIVPSLAVVLAAITDIVVTLSIVNLMGIKISAAGIAAFLMLIGYSVDTNILLTMRVLKRTEGTVFERILSAMRTGILMSLTTLVVVIIGLILSSSAVITQILTIILIGLLVDQISTWIQNVAIIRIYTDKKNN
jgi:preprotein translocase subunit SecF